MSRRLIVLPPAEQDILEAYQWYESHRDGLGDDFLLTVEAAFSAIEVFPDHAPLTYKNYRRYSLSRFPYFVFYSTTEKTVDVHAVYHSSRDPLSWIDRQ
ncbi:MAG TPA: type II toxin-antitoxin system RelE/ParE family toxin [Phycisphaerae bacterium]|nr:type II toxin-antitoxin system RelE/ParE family toxin [Phycisphaerae bacterium]